jgi:tight adherence protein B
MIAMATGLLALAGVFAAGAAASAGRPALRIGPGAPRRAHAPLTTARIRRIVVPAAALAVAAVAGPIAGAAGAAAVVGVDRAMRSRRRSLADRSRHEQLPDAAAALAAGLRAGLSLPQALAYARDEAAPPLADDLSELVGAVELGTPVGEALAAWADAIGSDDARLIAGVLDVHRRSGGDLPAVLDGVVATLRERRAAVREIRALTAQARLSGVILGTLPIGFFGFLLLTSRAEMLAAISTPLGRTAVAVGIALELAAFLWIRRLLEIR